MAHEHGDVPGPTTKRGEQPAGSARPGQRAAEAQPSPPAPLGYGEEASENLGAANPPAPTPEKYHDPSEGESSTRTSAPHHGGGYTLIPGEDS